MIDTCRGLPQADVDRFPSWPKIPRLSKDIAITEKVDGTNALIHVERRAYGESATGLPDGVNVVMDVDGPADADGFPLGEFWVRAGSRNRWLTEAADNFGFARWVRANANQLVRLGTGHHYGEWYGSGIQRGYGLTNGEKRFALFNVARWKDTRAGVWPAGGYPYEKAQQTPDCVTVVPLLAVVPGDLMTSTVDVIIRFMEANGSQIVKGFPRPEGVVVWHEGASQYFKAFTQWEAK